MAETPTTLERLAAVLGVPVDAFFDAQERPTDRGVSLEEPLSL